MYKFFTFYSPYFTEIIKIREIFKLNDKLLSKHFKA